MFIDTHLHVADKQFDADRESVLSRAREAQVLTFIEIAESPSTWDAAVALADKHPFVYASLGIHPHHAHEAGPDQWPALREKLKRLLSHPKVLAVGEVGLDYFRMRNNKGQQQHLFRQQLELARELNKPIVIHCRENERPKAAGEESAIGRTDSAASTGMGCSAHQDVQKALVEFFPTKYPAMNLDQPNGVVHCF